MTVDIAVVGAGRRGRDHLDALEGLDSVEVVAVADVDESRAESAADPHGATAHGDPRSLIEKEAPDALVVGLPPFVHADLDRRAAERGIHLFVEPPVALSLEDARAVAAAAEDGGIVAQSGYQRRFADAYREAASILDGRTVGLIDGYCFAGVPNLDWWRDRDKSGGQVIEQATHVYDAVRYLGGDVEEVTAYGGRRVVDAVDFEDVVTASATHANGAVSHVGSTCATEDARAGLEIVAEDAHIELRGNRLEGQVDGQSVEYEGTNDPSAAGIEAFVDAIASGDDSATAATYADAVETLAVTEAVTESIRRDEPVAVGD